ncbi:MAG: hypothetical protein ACFCD0_03930 [Gemmataceae bacterium]
MPSSSSPSPYAGPTQTGESREGRLNRALETAVKHDLPNTLVALRGMLGMLEADKERLSPSGQDCLHRLVGIAKKMQHTVETLRAIHTVALRPSAPENQSVQEAFEEARRRTQRLHPFVSFVIKNELTNAAAWAPATLLVSGFTEALSLLTKVVALPEVFYLVKSHERTTRHASRAPSQGDVSPGRILEVVFSAAGSSGIDLHKANRLYEAGSQDLDYDSFGKDHRMELILLDEISRTCGGTFSAEYQVEDVFQIRLAFPQSSI